MLIYYDGIHIEKYPNADGITTNCTLMAGRNYNEFYQEKKSVINGRPISFQVWEDDPIHQIQQIHAINPDIFVKVPIVDTRGEWNDAAIRYCNVNSIPLNVTAIYTKLQIEKAREFLVGMKAPIIISIFAGPISDIGIDPNPFIHCAKQMFPEENAKILWAGCREVYTIVRAERAGCDIITVPDSVYEKFMDKSKTLEQLSIERVRKFQNDAKNGHTRIGIQ